MGRDLRGLLRYFAGSVRHPEVSGFEVLDVRSKIAEREGELSPEERKELEAADGTFLRNAGKLCSAICEAADLAEMRERAGASPSHWWWYLDKLVQVERVAR
jgi:hypothetical protein